METHDQLGSNRAVWQWRSKGMGHFRYHFRDLHSSWCSSIPGHSSVKHDTCHRTFAAAQCSGMTGNSLCTASQSREFQRAIRLTAAFMTHNYTILGMKFTVLLHTF